MNSSGSDNDEKKLDHPAVTMASVIAKVLAGSTQQQSPAAHGPLRLRLPPPSDFVAGIIAESMTAAAVAGVSIAPGTVVVTNQYHAIKKYMDSLYAELELVTAERDMLRANLQTAEATFTELQGKLIRLRAITEPAGTN